MPTATRESVSVLWSEGLSRRVLKAIRLPKKHLMIYLLLGRVLIVILTIHLVDEEDERVSGMPSSWARSRRGHVGRLLNSDLIYDAIHCTLVAGGVDRPSQ